MIILDKYKKLYFLGLILLFLGTVICINNNVNMLFPLVLIVLGNTILVIINILNKKGNKWIFNLFALNLILVLYYYLVNDKNLGILNNFLIAFIIIIYYIFNRKLIRM